jgi:hypothetical protein
MRGHGLSTRMSTIRHTTLIQCTQLMCQLLLLRVPAKKINRPAILSVSIVVFLKYSPLSIIHGLSSPHGAILDTNGALEQCS